MPIRKVICSIWWLAMLPQADIALADLAQKTQFSIESQPLQEALTQYSAQSGVQITGPSDLIIGKSSIGVVGQYPAHTALTRLLTGTTLSFDVIDLNTVALRAVVPEADASPLPSAGDGTPEIAIQAQEPRFAAPTRRDRIGRVWAPVLINGRGPYRLVLDSGAGGSGVTMPVVQELGLPLDRTPPVILRGVTGTVQVRTTRVASLLVGDIVLEPDKLLVIPDALDGAEGILDTKGFKDRRIFIDFHNALIRITRSSKERAAPGFLTVPFRLVRGQIYVRARVGTLPVAAIINTGGQSTLANDAMRNALFDASKPVKSTSEQITGVTADVQMGDSMVVPDIQFGPIAIRQSSVIFGDMRIFQHLDLIGRPTLLIGMDTIGSFDTFIIDYKRRELQIRMRDQADSEQAAGTTSMGIPLNKPKKLV
jgi:hypothetical protein